MRLRKLVLLIPLAIGLEGPACRALSLWLYALEEENRSSTFA